MTNPKLEILKLELIINERLYNQGIITEIHYNEVSKLIKDKIRRIK